MDYNVHIAYRDKAMNVISEREYTLSEYCDLFRFDLLRIIGDVQNSFISAFGQKENWPQEVSKQFQLIRHKLLDKGGQIQRLPDNIHTGKPVMKNGTFADLINDTFGDGPIA